jgi:hydrogenase maturation protein HypF
MLEIGFVSHQNYIAGYLESFFEEQKISVNVSRIGTTVLVEADENDPRLERAIHALNEQMPYSLFMTSVSHRFSQTPFQRFRKNHPTTLPLNLGICPRCTAEMLDPGSRRYYYPFCSCRQCGAQYAFFERYPYTRANTGLRFMQPCPECEAELKANPFRRDYAQISCHKCGIPLKMSHNGKVLYADDAESYKRLFEAAAEAVAEGETLVMKTTFGYRRFHLAKAENISAASILLHINSHTLMQDLSLAKQEIESLYSLEKPLLKTAVQSESLRGLFGDFVLCKVPDEAFTILLCKELEALHVDYIAYEESEEGDLHVGFDLPMISQSDMRLFIDADARFVRSGERVSFPAEITTPVDTLSVTDNLVAIKSGRNHLIDRMEHFEGATAAKMNLLEGCESGIEHSNIHPFGAAQGALMSVLASHKLKESAVGVYFEGDAMEFLYFNGENTVTLVPSVPFEPGRLIEKLTTLREGSDRLVTNLAMKRPELYAELKRIEEENPPLFDVVSAIVGLHEDGFDALDDAALKFVGKGGTKVDTTFGDTRFNPYALIASLISYKMADVDPVLLSYSLFESLGDYFVDILTQLQNRSKAVHVVLCGEQIAQSSLYGRITEKIRTPKPLVNRSFPVGKEGSVVGGIYL